MKYRFQHFIDIATSAASAQVLTFSVGGNDVIKRCSHLFNAYKYFKLGKISVKFVPASTLPVDPLGMSYDDADPNTIDPRDQLNPGLVRITNGEDIKNDLTGVDITAQMAMYEAMLLDPRWYKFNLQSGFKRTAYPLYWQVGELHQDMWPGAQVNVPTTSTAGEGTTLSTGNVSTCSLAFNGNFDANDTLGAQNTFRNTYEMNFSNGLALHQVGHRGRIGWLPTDAYNWIWNGTVGKHIPMVHPVPQINVITCFLPKAYKTLYYYRVYITEEVSFSGLRSIAPNSVIENTEYSYRGIDNFFVPPSIFPKDPSEQQNYGITGLNTASQSNNGAGRD